MALVLVTGASGFVGSHLCEELYRQGYRLRLLMRPTSSKSNLSAIEDYEIALGKLENKEDLNEAVRGVDYIFHLGGLVATIDEKRFFAVNKEGTKNLALAAKEHAPGLKRFVYVSSLAAGGPAEPGKSKTEEEIPAPVSSYGKSKLGGEEVLKKYTPKLPFVILRPPVVYGPRDHALLFLVQLLKKGKEIALGNPEYNAYSFIQVEDLVQAIVLASQKNLPSGEIFYASGDGVYTWKEATDFLKIALKKEEESFRRISIPVPVIKLLGHIFSLVEFLTKKKMFINRDRSRELSQSRWTCSNEKARSVLGFAPEWSLERGLCDVVDWYDQHGWL